MVDRPLPPKQNSLSGSLIPPPEIHLDLTGIAEKTLKGAVTLTFRCAQPATGPDPPLRKALLDAVAFSEVEVRFFCRLVGWF